MIVNDLLHEQTYSRDFYLIYHLMEAPKLQNCVFSTMAEYGQRFAHTCNGNATSDKNY